VVNAANKIFPAVITGNTIVLKPSPYTPLATVMLAEIAAKAFPPGVANIITGGNDIGQMLVEHPDVKMVSFTGSNATGKKIMATCAGKLKKLMLELGGNDPAIILPGSDIPKLAPMVFQKAMFNTGQVCTALKRLYVHSSQYDEMVELLSQRAKQAKLGNGMEAGVQYGPLNNKMQLERVEMLVEEAQQVVPVLSQVASECSQLAHRMHISTPPPSLPMSATQHASSVKSNSVLHFLFSSTMTLTMQYAVQMTRSMD